MPTTPVPTDRPEALYISVDDHKLLLELMIAERDINPVIAEFITDTTWERIEEAKYGYLELSGTDEEFFEANDDMGFELRGDEVVISFYDDNGETYAIPIRARTA